MFFRKLFLLIVCLLYFALNFSACASSVTSANTMNTSSYDKNDEPPWVSDPYTKYDKQENVAAVGRAGSREMAEKIAFGNLVAIFGQIIQVNEKVSSSYKGAVKNGVTANWAEDTAVNTAIITSAGMNSLIGAEILDRWNDGKNFYAAAVLNKAKALQTYSIIVKSNQSMIENLTNMPLEEKNTLNGLARYQFAATIADLTIPYVTLLSIIGGPTLEFKHGVDLRLEAINITRAIPIGLNVQNDKSGRIQGAFAKALSDIGFSSGGSNSPYLLDVYINTSPSLIAGNPYKFTRIELKADLKDAKTGTVFLPYNFNTRERHTTQEEADNRAYIYAERKINKEYSNLLISYLSVLLTN